VPGGVVGGPLPRSLPPLRPPPVPPRRRRQRNNWPRRQRAWVRRSTCIIRSLQPCIVPRVREIPRMTPISHRRETRARVPIACARFSARFVARLSRALRALALAPTSIPAPRSRVFVRDARDSLDGLNADRTRISSGSLNISFPRFSASLLRNHIERIERIRMCCRWCDFRSFVSVYRFLPWRSLDWPIVSVIANAHTRTPGRSPGEETGSLGPGSL